MIQNQNDFKTTIFVGNMPFTVSEEQVRSHFSECGKIENVRIIRDSKTHLGKGIGYLQFEEKTAMRKAIDDLHEKEFQGRKLRIKKAVEPKRMEKKERKKQERADNRKADQKDKDKEIPKHLQGKEFGDIVSSDDSEDEKPSDFKTALEKEKNQMDNQVMFNKRKRQALLKEMISGKGKKEKELTDK